MDAPRITVIDDDPVTCHIFERVLRRCDCRYEVFRSGREALQRLRQDPADVVVTDLRMPEVDGMAVLRTVKRSHPETLVIMITGYSTVENAVEAMKQGAYDYLRKPFDPDELTFVLRRALEQRRLARENQELRQRLLDRDQLEREMVGRHPKMLEVFQRIDKVAQSTANVLIIGETGTGKELVARAIHARGPRRAAPFVPINCGALSESLLENELFGHEKGAFTGAVEQKKGLLETAHGGTLFLDEVGSISESLQVKLLRFIQERSFLRVGGTSPVHVDVRIIAATNRDLEALVEQGRFREDLFHRLNVVRIALPPLRERREDIPMLVEHFLKKFAVLHGAQAPLRIAPEALDLLTSYHWKGNVRELENAVERAVTLMDGGDTVRVEDLPSYLQERVEKNPGLQGRTLKDVERAHIIRILRETGGERAKAARILGINKSTLWRKIKEYRIQLPS